jgi:hypothetical protein
MRSASRRGSVSSKYTQVPMDFDTVQRDITLSGGIAAARAYIEEPMPRT